MNKNIFGNELYFKTFDSSNVNKAELELPELNLSENEEIQLDFPSEYGFSSELKEINTKNYNYYKSIVAKENETVNERINYVSENQLIELTDIKSEKNSVLNVILNYSKKLTSDFRSSLIRVKALENSTINLFIIQTEENKKAVESIVSEVEENAVFNLYQYEVGSVELYSNYKANLTGENSTVNVNSIYFGYEMNELNLLYDIFHIGENTNSNIIVNGALRDKSYKNFKSTLDFKEGSRGSAGSEEEYAVLLSDDVLAVSVPVLLAHEDDVQGNHAASAGKIDSELLFYLMSRGLDQHQAEYMIILSKFSKAIDAIEDSELRENLNEMVKEIVRR